MTENGHGKSFIDVTLVEIHLTLKKVDVQPIRHWKSGLLMNSTTYVCTDPFPLSVDTTIFLPGGRVPVQLETKIKSNQIKSNLLRDNIYHHRIHMNIRITHK
jgi:hypothetical protein